MRAWGLVPAAVDERTAATGSWPAPRPGPLLDRGVLGRPWPRHRARGRASAGAGPPQRAAIAWPRPRIETTITELTAGLGLSRHGARTLWGLLTRTAATLLARTLLRLTLT